MPGSEGIKRGKRIRTLLTEATPAQRIHDYGSYSRNAQGLFCSDFSFVPNICQEYRTPSKSNGPKKRVFFIECLLFSAI